MRVFTITLLGLALLAAPSAAFDLVLLKDGRLVEGKLLSDGSDGTVVLQLPGADIPISMDLIDKFFVEDLEGYVPKSKLEEEQIKKGRVLFEGSWSRAARRTPRSPRRCSCCGSRGGASPPCGDCASRARASTSRAPPPGHRAAP